MTVANRSAAPMAVTVTPRPWVQAATGKVAPNRRGTLPGVSVDKSTFTLAPGAEQVVTATLASAPGGRLPLRRAGGHRRADRRRDAQGRRARLPAGRRAPDPAGGAEVHDHGGQRQGVRRTAVIPIKNTGNTLDPVAGSVKVKGASGTKNLTVASVKILPGKTVNLPAGTKLAKGSYTATVSLTQHGKKALSVTKKFKVK